MPTFNMEIPELEESVQRPVVTAILTRLMKDTRLVAQQCPIFYPGLQEAIAVPGSTMDDNERPTLRLESDKRLEIEITEEVLHQQYYPLNYTEFPNIFEDNQKMISAKTIYEQIEVKVTVNYICPDRVSAFNWQRGIKRRINQFVTDHMHTVNYHYIIPDEITYMLMLFHDMGEKHTPTHKEFGEWLQEHFLLRNTWIANQAGNHPRPAIEQQQVMIYGNYDFNYEIVEIERKSDAGAYGASFTYTFMYERPERIVMAYPLVIGNLLLPKKYISADESYDKDIHDGIKPLSLDYFQWHQFNGMVYSAKWGVGIPYFNDFTPPNTARYYFELFRVLCLIDTHNPKGLFYLDYRQSEDLGLYRFPDYTLQYMKDFRQKMLLPNEHLFNVQVYRWDYIQDYSRIVIDENLQVTMTEDLGLDSMWNSTLSLVRELKYLSDQALKDLLKYPEVIKDYIDAIYPNNNISLDDIKHWTEKDIIDYARNNDYTGWIDEGGWHSNDQNQSYPGGPVVPGNGNPLDHVKQTGLTVNVHTIIARRMENK